MEASQSLVKSCPCCGHERCRLLHSKYGFDLVECESCSLAYIANPPNAETLKRIYSPESNYHARLIDPEVASSVLLRAEADLHLRLLESVTKGKKLLDNGCSVGFFMERARAHGWDVVGVEPNGFTATIARDQRRLDVVENILDSVDLNPQSFDAVTMWDVIEHVTNPLATLQTAHRLLKTGGVVGLSTPNIDGLFPRVSHKFAKLVGFWPHPEPPHHLFQFSENTLTRLLNKAGFEIVKVHHFNIPLSYSLGKFATIVRRPRMLLYYIFFAPMALLGPKLGLGDSIVVFASKQ